LLILLLVLCTSFLSAQTTWNGGGDGTSWEDPLNWTAGIPDLADRVIIGAGNTVIISSAAEAESVDNSGDLTIQPNHSLTIIGASVFDGISNQGTVINKGTGNPENAQQLCLPLNAANTHIGNHGGCYFGVCSSGMIVSGDDGSGAAPGQQQRNASGSSPIVETEQGKAYFFELTPNPASGLVNVHLHGHSAGAHLYIRDQLGRLVYNQPVDAADSHFDISLADGRFAAGTYFVTILSDGEMITRRLVVVK
jgi:hypothetical protein